MARPKTMEIQTQASLPDRTAEQVEGYRFANRIGTETGSIRPLIERGLKVVKAEKPKKAA